MTQLPEYPHPKTNQQTKRCQNKGKTFINNKKKPNMKPNKTKLYIIRQVGQTFASLCAKVPPALLWQLDKVLGGESEMPAGAKCRISDARGSVALKVPIGGYLRVR